MEIRTIPQNNAADNQTQERKQRKQQEVTTYGITYVKTDYPSDLVIDVLRVLRQSCTAIDAFYRTAFERYVPTGDVEADEEYQLTGDDVWAATAQEMATRVPMAQMGKNIFVNSTISINSLKVRLGINLGFEINIRYEVQDRKAEITKCTGLVHIYGRNVALTSSLEENGFTIVPNRRNNRQQQQ